MSESGCLCLPPSGVGRVVIVAGWLIGQRFFLFDGGLDSACDDVPRTVSFTSTLVGGWWRLFRRRHEFKKLNREAICRSRTAALGALIIEGQEDQIRDHSFFVCVI